MTISFLQLNTCMRCCRTYLTSETLKRHIRYAHSVNRIRCQWCPYKVSRNPIVRIFRIVRRQTTMHRYMFLVETAAPVRARNVGRENMARHANKGNNSVRKAYDKSEP